MAAYLLLTRAAPMRLHRRQARRRVRTAPASRAHTPACLTALRSNLFFAAKPPNHKHFHRPLLGNYLVGCVPSAHSRRTYAASPPPDTQTCAHSSCVARAHICVSDGSKVEHFLCGKAAYVRKNLYICSMKFLKIFLTICRAVVGFLIDNKYCLWCITHRKKWW